MGLFKIIKKLIKKWIKNNKHNKKTYVVNQYSHPDNSNNASNGNHKPNIIDNLTHFAQDLNYGKNKHKFDKKMKKKNKKLYKQNTKHNYYPNQYGYQTQPLSNTGTYQINNPITQNSIPNTNYPLQSSTFETYYGQISNNQNEYHPETNIIRGQPIIPIQNEIVYQTTFSNNQNEYQPQTNIIHDLPNIPIQNEIMYQTTNSNIDSNSNL
ncbi:Hypothetical protein KVN_LOCUS86 [uncultured virus]|nr:Hypothetical protein KVN_LOCUS86 [uncultured virus]